MSASVSRRAFLKGVGAGTLTLSLRPLQWISPTEASGALLEELSYRGWEDVYRQTWRWDKVGRSTHFVNCWTQASCTWNVYVKNGMVWREEQAAIYPHEIPGIPDLNPRGCQKGACFSQRMYDPTRVKYPLKRAGKRGEGKWERVSWNQALTEIADAFIDTLTKEGPAAINWDFGTQVSFGPQGLGLFRSAFLLDTPLWDPNPDIGDDDDGVAVTVGKVHFGHSLGDMFNSSMVLIWGANPVYTQIPNMHYVTEARYHGTRIVSICPDYSPSTLHADLWVPVRIGTDAALALALSQVIVSERLHNVPFLKEQTDMSLLVRDDTRLFLREADLKEGGADDVFYAWDLRSNGIRPMPKTTLRLDDLDPALEGKFEAETRTGKVKVRPVFDLLTARLQEYAPEKATRICGTHPDLIRRLAREIARARAVLMVPQKNFSKFYHGLEMDRTRLLVLALCGHIGRKGAGFQAFPFLVPDAITEGFMYPSMALPKGKELFDQQHVALVKSLKDRGYTDEMISYEPMRQVYENKFFVSSVLQLFFHGGLRELMRDQRTWDPAMKRDIDEYVNLALGKRWQFAYPDIPPRILVAEGGNFLRRFRGYPKLVEVFVPKLRLLVDINWRMSNTGRHADFILPCTAWYECDEIKWATTLVPYVHGAQRVVEPLGEAMQAWKIHCLLAKKIQERAIERGITRFKDRADKERRLDNFYDELTYHGHYKEDEIDKLAADFVKVSGNLKGVTWEQLKKDGSARFSSVGTNVVSIGNATDLRPGETVVANTWHTEKKIPWPTLTRRMQFYIDHELFFELGEELPVHKEETIGGNYPLRMTGGHTRHSIHTSWRDDALMLRLQRGEPAMFVSAEDATARRIEDNDLVRVFNDIGSFQIRAIVSHAVAPGQVIVYHAWEPYMFKGQASYQTNTPSPINPVELAGQYYHLRPMLLIRTPGQNDRGLRVDVEKVTGESSVGMRL